jgi:hypothetical protein
MGRETGRDVIGSNEVGRMEGEPVSIGTNGSPNLLGRRSRIRSRRGGTPNALCPLTASPACRADAVYRSVY